MKKKLMVTGASGFVGSNFIERYKDQYEIIPVCLIENKPEDLDYTGVDCILHLAALVHQMNGAPEEKYFEINTKLTERLATKVKAEGVSHFVFYSTVKVFGYDGDIKDHDYKITTKTECHPSDPYGKSKYEAEKILRKLESKEFKVVCIRPPMIYGPGVKGNMESLVKLINLFPILPLGFKENKRSLVYTGNLLAITADVINKEKTGIIIPQDEKPVSIDEIAKGIAEALGKKRIFFKLPKLLFSILNKIKPNIMVRLYGSLQFERTEKVETSMKDGLREMVEVRK